MLKSFPGEAPELDSLNAQRGRSQTKTAPGCRVFRYWMDKPRTKGYDRRANSGRRQRSPVGAGDCPERKQKHRIPMPKSFPWEAPEPDSLNVQSGRGHTKPLPDVVSFATGWTIQGQRALTGEQIQAGATAHQYAPENVRKENRNTGYRCLKLFPGKVSESIFLIAAGHYLIKWENFSQTFPVLIIFISPFFVLFSLKSGKREKKHGFFICIFLPNPSFPTVCRGLPRSIHGQK